MNQQQQPTQPDRFERLAYRLRDEVIRSVTLEASLAVVSDRVAAVTATLEEIRKATVGSADPLPTIRAALGIPEPDPTPASAETIARPSRKAAK